MNLTDKQQRFCEEYVIDLNATQAAIRAGYSEKTAAEIGCENLTKPNIQETIQKLKEEISNRNKITVDECVGLLAKMARFDMSDLYDENGNIKSIHDIPEDTRLAISELTSMEEFQGFGKDRELIGYSKKIKTIDRKGSIVELMKHLGGYEKDNSQKGERIPSREERDKFLKEFKEALNNAK